MSGAPTEVHDLRSRIGGSLPPLAEESAERLCERLRAVLIRAAKRDAMICTRKDVNDEVVLADPPQDLARKHPDARAIVAGSKDRATKGALRRPDGAWLHFAVTVREHGSGPLVLLAYGFEVCFPGGHAPEWLRFDLNPPGSDNDDRGMRSHFHPGNKSIQVPCAAMTPADALLLCIYDVQVRHR